MLVFLTLTQECNLKCNYCGGGELYDIEDTSQLPHPKHIKFDISALKKLNKIKDLSICFYGGEPLMAEDLITKAINLLPNVKKFVLQTNGTLLKRFKHFKQMETILVSLDGEAEITDYSRGNGTFKKAIEGCLFIKNKGFTGDLIARMTVHKESDIFDDVKALINYRDDITGKYLFDHVHWQLDVLWDTPGLARWFDQYESWLLKYNKGITQLAKWFIKELNKQKNPRILGIAPFLALTYTYIKGIKKNPLRCGSGINSFNLTTGGIFTNCPIAPEYDKIESIEKKDFDFHKDVVNGKGVKTIGGYCNGCDVLDECGGRCLYANKKIWNEKDEKNFRKVCKSVKHLLKVVKEIIVPEVEKLIKEKKYALEDFNYPKYNNSVEVIP